MDQALTPAGSRPVAALDAVPEHAQYLTFQLAGRTFAIGILHIKEIIEYGKVTAVPMMPAFIRGVINLRGNVVPVIDLAARFGTPSQVQRRTCIVIVEVADNEGTQDIGIMVDAVHEVLEIVPADIERPPSFGTGISTEFIEGMGKVGEEFVIILALDHILSTEEVALLAQVGTGA